MEMVMFLLWLGGPPRKDGYHALETRKDKPTIQRSSDQQSSQLQSTEGSQPIAWLLCYWFAGMLSTVCILWFGDLWEGLTSVSQQVWLQLIWFIAETMYNLSSTKLLLLLRRLSVNVTTLYYKLLTFFEQIWGGTLFKLPCHSVTTPRKGYHPYLLNKKCQWCFYHSLNFGQISISLSISCCWHLSILDKYE